MGEDNAIQEWGQVADFEKNVKVIETKILQLSSASPFDRGEVRKLEENIEFPEWHLRLDVR